MTAVTKESSIGNPAEPRKSAEHMAQLDGLRALAVLAVAWWHWMPLRHYGISWGPLGVQLFFVLSGFLITGILLDVRARVNDSDARWFGLRRFYIRRFLRIFPLYYAALAVGLLMNWPPLRETWMWHSTYMVNFYMYLKQTYVGHIGHFWSLSVEEQFYLCWPFLVLFVPRRLVPTMILLSIAVAPLFRTFAPMVRPDDNFVRFLTPSCLDSLGVGALLAYAAREEVLGGAARVARILLVVGIAGAAVTCGLNIADSLQSTFAAFIFGWVVYVAAKGIKGPVGAFLSCGPIVYLGKISYGLYVIHDLALYMAPPVVTFLHLPADTMDRGLFRLPLLIVLTIVPAMLSWHLYEKPLNELKRFFPYTRKEKARPVPVVIAVQAEPPLT